MGRTLVADIERQTDILMHNFKTMVQTCDMEAMLDDMPLWKHAYHALYALDRWYINPTAFREPPFHDIGLDSLDAPPSGQRTLRRESLVVYLATVQKKIARHLEGLQDEQLSERPEGCEYTRMELILSQFQHANAHIGMINAVTIAATGQWPRVVGIEGNLRLGLYEE